MIVFKFLHHRVWMRINNIFPKSKSISKKMLAAIFLASSLVTFTVTCIQLSFDYFQEMSSLKKNMVLVDKSYSRSVALSLWDFRHSQLQAQLEGILSVPGIQNVQVIEKNKVIAKAGSFKEAETLVSRFDLFHYEESNKKIRIGQLVVTASVDEVLNKILQKVFLIFVTQLFKTLLVSFIIYLCIQQIVTRHLVHISKYLRETNLDLFDQPLSLEREKTPDGDDELDTLVYSLNEMREKISQSHQSLNLLNKELEEKVELKTQLIIDQRIKLEQSAKMSTLGEIAGGIAHEINNPIAIISATNRILRKTMDKGITDPKVYNKYFDDIDHTVVRISKIITGLRIVSRDAATEEFKNEKLIDIFDDVLALCGEKFKGHGIQIQVDLEDEVYQTSINCGRVQLSQVFLNLLGNAFDAIEELPEKWIKIDCQKIDGNLIIRLTDSGRGISKDIQEKILQPFFTTKALGKGTGLGLSVSNSIIKMHGGKFTLDNTSINTCFELALPIQGKISDKMSA